MSIASLLLAVVGFSYNTWRLEVTEDNNNIRTAAFEVLQNLSELEQVIFSAYYDNDTVEGSPRKGWVKVGLINDLSTLISPEVEKDTMILKQYWSENWSKMSQEQDVVDNLGTYIDKIRYGIKLTLTDLS